MPTAESRSTVQSRSSNFIPSVCEADTRHVSLSLIWIRGNIQPFPSIQAMGKSVTSTPVRMGKSVTATPVRNSPARRASGHSPLPARRRLLRRVCPQPSPRIPMSEPRQVLIIHLGFFYLLWYHRIRPSSPATVANNGYHHEDSAQPMMGETQQMVLAAVDTVFAARRAATQSQSQSISTARSELPAELGGISGADYQGVFAIMLSLESNIDLIVTIYEYCHKAIPVRKRSSARPRMKLKAHCSECRTSSLHLMISSASSNAT